MEVISSSKNGDIIQVTNPADGTTVGIINAGTSGDANDAVKLAADAFYSWANTESVDRGKILYSAAMRIREDKRNLAYLLTSEQGKPLRESLNEISGCARILEYYASTSGVIRGDYSKSPNYGHMLVSRRPIGVCAAIIPWNVPAIIMGWKIGPVLAAGNTMVLKPSQTAPLTCLAIAEHLYSAGIPREVLSVVTGSGMVVGEALAKHPDIRSLSFTGAVETGKRVALLSASTLKRVVLELGGSDAMIVCNDADLDLASKGAVSGRFFNCGQTCTAIKRVFVEQSVYDSFVSRIHSLVEKMNIGNGLTKGVDIGPMHTREQRERIVTLLEKVQDKDEGKILTGGTIPEESGLINGNFIKPAVLTDVSPDSQMMKEEVFGPVLPIVSYNKFDDALFMANDTRYGLGASIWTHDMKKISKGIEELQAGIVWVNQHLRIPPEVPFGGVKESGIGRENGRYAIEHYLFEKSILIKD